MGHGDREKTRQIAAFSVGMGLGGPEESQHIALLVGMAHGGREERQHTA